MKEEVKNICKQIAILQWQLNHNNIAEDKADEMLTALSLQLLCYTSPAETLSFMAEIDDYVQTLLSTMEKLQDAENIV